MLKRSLSGSLLWTRKEVSALPELQVAFDACQGRQPLSLLQMRHKIAYQSHSPVAFTQVSLQAGLRRSKLLAYQELLAMLFRPDCIPQN